jgi:hypothetical protein
MQTGWRMGTHLVALKIHRLHRLVGRDTVHLGLQEHALAGVERVRGARVVSEVVRLSETAHLLQRTAESTVNELQYVANTLQKATSLISWFTARCVDGSSYSPSTHGSESINSFGVLRASTCSREQRATRRATKTPQQPHQSEQQRKGGWKR